jgi:hypothetical protein
MLPLHCCPASQTKLQAPQLKKFDVVSMHCPPQNDNPLPQPHCPLLQGAPVVHAIPH